MRKSEYVKINLNQLNEKQAKILIENFYADIINSRKDVKQWLLSEFLGQMLNSFFELKMYHLIVSIFESENINEGYFENNYFIIAYSYSELNDLHKSKMLYNKLLSSQDDSSAAYNNLGLILEQEADFEGAEYCYLCGLEINPENGKLQRNYERLQGKIKEEEKNDKKYFDAAKNFENENSYIKEKMKLFMASSDVDGNIACSYYGGSSILKVSRDKSFELITKWQQNDYIIKLDFKDEETRSNVYKINKYIISYLEDYEIKNEFEKQLLSKIDKLTINELENIGYNNELIKSIDLIIGNEKLKFIIQRDLKELGILVLMQLNKSALILGGSIIEAILLSEFHHRGVMQVEVNGRQKKIERMDLHELINEAHKQNIISESLYYLSNGIRGFRNLVHPGVENRKEELDVSNENVDIMWNVLKKMVIELKKIYANNLFSKIL